MTQKTLPQRLREQSHRVWGPYNNETAQLLCEAANAIETKEKAMPVKMTNAASWYHPGDKVRVVVENSNLEPFWDVVRQPFWQDTGFEQGPALILYNHSWVWERQVVGSQSHQGRDHPLPDQLQSIADMEVLTKQKQ